MPAISVTSYDGLIPVVSISDVRLPKEPANEKNKSGSARTDFSGNEILSRRAKKRQLLHQHLKEMSRTNSENLDGGHVSNLGCILQDAINNEILGDVVLTSALMDSQSGVNLISDEFSSTNVYNEDTMLNPSSSSLSSELIVPENLLSESTHDEFCSGANDFGSPSMNLKDLE